MISREQFISDLTDALGWPYSSPGDTGKDCSKSGIDCSGMAVRAFKLQGDNSLYHGCNTMWRDGTFSEKGVLTSVNQLEPGDAVLLNRPWRESDKDNKWYGDPEGNMTHIGYVKSINPFEIIDASYSAGKVRTTKAIKTVGWNRYGKFKKMSSKSAEKKEAKLMTVVVKSSNGKGANLRERSSTTSKLLCNIPDATVLEITKLGDSWTKVSYNGKEGYVLSKLLFEVEDTIENETLEETVKRHELMLQQLMNAVFDG